MDVHRTWGWIIPNHAKYLYEGSQAHKKEMAAIRQKRFRIRNATVTHSNATVTPASISISSSESLSQEGGCKGERWTLEQCVAAASPIGMPLDMVTAFWNHYAAVDFIDGAGRQITNLAAALGKWKASQQDRKAGKTPGGSRLPPSIRELLAQRDQLQVDLQAAGDRGDNTADIRARLNAVKQQIGRGGQ
jgi:hypothetical protein